MLDHFVAPYFWPVLISVIPWHILRVIVTLFGEIVW